MMKRRSQQMSVPPLVERPSCLNPRAKAQERDTSLLIDVSLSVQTAIA